VIGLGFNLTGSVGVVSLGRQLNLTAYVGYMRCRLFLWMFRLELVKLGLTQPRLNT